MSDFLEVASIEQIPPGRSLVVTVAGKGVALFNVEGQIYAIDDACVHQGASLGSGAARLVGLRTGPSAAPRNTFGIARAICGGLPA